MRSIITLTFSPRDATHSTKNHWARETGSGTPQYGGLLSTTLFSCNLLPKLCRYIRTGIIEQYMCT